MKCIGLGRNERMIDFDQEDLTLEANGAPGFEGYLYQLDVSIWVALDFVVAKQVAGHVVLEPAGQEDLEAPLDESELGPILSGTPLAGRQLIVQAKLRSTGPWTGPSLSALLMHGLRRESAAARLEREPDAAFLLVTSADLSGEVRSLRAPGLNPSGWSSDVPATIAKLIPNASGRLAIVSTEDRWKLRQHLRRLMEEAFRVPRAKFRPCLAALRAAAVERMRGVAGGRWSRDEIAAVLRDHGGRLSRSAERETFVPPTNWRDIRGAMAGNNAVILTGTSGTGKTTAARVLAEVLQDETPGLSIVSIDKGPEQIRYDQTVEPVVFLIDDPWGHYRFEPKARPWNDELRRLLESASANRGFIITSRTDVMRESGARSLPSKWCLRLEPENYGIQQRIRLFENRLPGVSPELQVLADSFRSDVLTELLSPLEIQKFFDLLGEGNQEACPDHVFLRRCIRRADEASIEDTVVQQVEARQATSAAAILWGLLKARSKLSREVVEQVESRLVHYDRDLEDALEPFINVFVAARHLRQDEKWISYYHPRIEKALESAILCRPQRTRRLLGLLADALADLDSGGTDDWGRESAALMLHAVSETPVLTAHVSVATQKHLDAWIANLLMAPGQNFRRNLQLAAAIGQKPISEVARWLVHKEVGPQDYFLASWSPTPSDETWYASRRADPVTAQLCDRFVRDVLPIENDGYPEDFCDHLDKLAPGLTPAFLDAAAKIVSHGPQLISDAIMRGALRDLDGFEAVTAAALEELDSIHSEPELWLSIRNGEYSEDYTEHLIDSHSEDGYVANELLQAYVKTLRVKRGWTAVANHQRAKELLSYWIADLRRPEAAFDRDELQAVLAHGIETADEKHLWQLLESRWIAEAAPPLVARLKSGADNERTRQAAVYCAFRRLPDALIEVMQSLETEAPNRLVELWVDLATSVSSQTSEDGADEIDLAGFLTVVSEPVANALRAVGNVTDGGEHSSVEAVEWLAARDPGTNIRLRLHLARALAAASADVSSHARQLLGAASENDAIDSEASIWAVEWFAAQGEEAILRQCLCHRFADVREGVLVALARRSQVPLPAELLALATDKGSRVRKRLLELLDSRRDPGHIPTLVTMAGDDWNESSGYYGVKPSCPISRRAAEILATIDNLSEAVVETIAEIASRMDDDGARDRLLTVLAHAGSDGQKKLVSMATNRNRVLLGAAAAAALLKSDITVDSALLTPINSQEILERRAVIAVEMALLIGRWGNPDQARAAAIAVAGHPGRRGLYIPLLIGASERSDGVREDLLSLGPRGLADRVFEAVCDRSKLRKEALDDGDPRIADQVLRRLAFLFESSGS